MAYCLIYSLRNVERAKFTSTRKISDQWEGTESTEDREDSHILQDRFERLNPAILVPASLALFIVISFYLVAGSIGNGADNLLGSSTTELYLARNGDNAIELGTGQLSSIWLLPEGVLVGADLALDNSGNFYTGSAGSSTFIKDDSVHAVVDVGITTNVGGVDEVPSVGWGNTCACIIGHAYIVSTDGDLYYRIFVEDTVQNSTGDVVGFVLTWAAMP